MTSTAPLRVAFVTPEFVTEKNFDGGLSNYLEKVARLLINSGHHPYIFVLSNQDKVFEHNGITVIRVRQQKRKTRYIDYLNKLTGRRCMALHPWYRESRLLDRALHEFQKEHQIDVVQYANYRATSIATTQRIPWLVRMSGYQPAWIEANGQKLAGAKKKQLVSMEDAVLRQAPMVISPSLLMANLAREKGATDVKVVRTPFAGNSKSHPLPPPALSQAKYLLYFGSIKKMKGISLIAEMIGELLSKHPSLHFVFAGKDLKIHGERASQLISGKAASSQDRIHFTGALKKTDLEQHITHATAIVLPSLIDNLPNTLLESLASGKIVIGPDGASFDELITHRKNGILFKLGDANDLRDKIELALSLPAAEKEALENAALATALRHSKNSQDISSHLSVYYSAIDQQAPPKNPSHGKTPISG